MIPDIKTVQIHLKWLTVNQIKHIFDIIEHLGFKNGECNLPEQLPEQEFYSSDDYLKDTFKYSSLNNDKILITYNQFVEWYRKEEDFWFTNSSAGVEIKIIYEN